MSFGLPEMKIWQEGDEVIVQVYVSGIDEKDVKLEVKNDFLKVGISKEFEAKTEKEGYVGEEWRSGSFDGVVSLPCKIVPMLPHYSYNGSVLEVRMKKAKK